MSYSLAVIHTAIAAYQTIYFIHLVVCIQFSLEMYTLNTPCKLIVLLQKTIKDNSLHGWASMDCSRVKYIAKIKKAL